MKQTRILPLILTLVFGSLSVRALPRDQHLAPRSRVSVVVTDRQTQDPLAGAMVTIASGGDTLRGVASKRSDYFKTQARFECDRMFRDSVTLEVSFLGFKPFSRRFSGPGFSGELSVELDIDEQSIAQVVVVGKRIAMVYRGDTTVYNAAAFKTMADDRLSELLKQLPGVEIRDNKIYADGEEVKRVYVDGRNLFGQQTSASLTDLRADDVRNVRVYEEQSAEALHTEDNTARKEKVMDVETKSKRGIVLGGEIAAMGGASLEKDYSGRREIRHAESFELYRHAETGSARIQASHKKDDEERENASPGAKITPTKQTNGVLSYDFRRGDTTSVTTYAMFGRRHESMLSASQTDYFPTDAYTLRSESGRRESLTKNLSASLNNTTRFLRGKNSLGTMFNFSYDQGTSVSADDTRQTIDAEQIRSLLNSDGRNRRISTNFSFHYRIRLSTRSSLLVRGQGGYSTQTDDNWRVDTTASTPGLRTRLRSDGDGYSYSYGGSVDYTYKTGERSALSAGYDFSRWYSRSKQLAVDYNDDPRGVLDTVNSFNYTVDYYTNALSLKWDLNRDDFTCLTALRAVMYDLTRNERFPQAERSRAVFSVWSPISCSVWVNPDAGFRSRSG